jgi:hypothetical protein
MRTAVDGIAFGGWTPIGAGLLASGAQLTGAPVPRAVLLISDGFQNVDPTVATALAGLPTGLRVYTVALGPAADAALLQSIATSTGGMFLNSPTALDLHLAYNDMRAGLTDSGLVVNQVDSAPATDIPVEPGADELTVSVAALAGKLGRLQLIAPSGRAVGPDDWGVTIRRGDGYTNLSVLRPATGIWRLQRGDQATAAAVAGFVRSPLRLRVSVPHLVEKGGPVEVAVRARFDKRVLRPSRLRIESSWHDRLAIPDGLDPDRDTEKLQALLRQSKPREQRQAWKGSSAFLPAGFSTVTVRIQGQLPAGSPFVRVLRRSVQVS